MNFTEIGKEYTEHEEQQTKILAAIKRMEWLDLKESPSVGLMPGMGIKGVIKEFHIPATHIAISPELAPFGLYGIRGAYKSGNVEIFFIDEGTGIVPIGSIESTI